MSLFELPSVPTGGGLDRLISPEYHGCRQPVINITLAGYLADVKAQIDEHQSSWERAKKATNPYEYIHTSPPGSRQPIAVARPISRSYFKMIEIFNSACMSDFLPYKGRVVYLAEGPGGFVEAIRWLRGDRDEHVAITLIETANPGVPGWRDGTSDPLVVKEVGPNGNGDLLRRDTFDYMVCKYGGTANLVTADGGFNFSDDFNNQEASSGSLMVAQSFTAIALQREGGCCVLKFFDTFTQLSIDLVYLLSRLYGEVSWMKPNTSRCANSEKYLVCKDYKLGTGEVEATGLLASMRNVMTSIENGLDPVRILSAAVPRLVTLKIEEVNAVLGQKQIDSILSTLAVIKRGKSDRDDLIKRNNLAKCVAWCQRNGVPFSRPCSRKTSESLSS